MTARLLQSEAIFVIKKSEHSSVFGATLAYYVCVCAGEYVLSDVRKRVDVKTRQNTSDVVKTIVLRPRPGPSRPSP